MRKVKGQYIFLIVFLIFGIVVAIQLKSTFYARKLTAANTISMDGLKEQLLKEQSEADSLRIAIDDNLIARDKIIKDFINQQKDFQAVADWEKAKLIAGLTDVKGPGITINLDDAPVRQPDTLVSLQIIHDRDIEVILNELKKAGAQAISINGERIVSTSEQLCAGPTILINGNRYSVPYYIEAIGDPDLLYDSLSATSKVYEMIICGIRVEIKKSREIVLSKFSGADNIGRYISGLEVVEK